ncbi:recombinase family protein [Mesorhizobium sp.]|uniref:recombinase family protein n=1 Tax=Mesorhizobium sp. TaxID=1871066 RepID=UPI002580859C|nr:recombinase family protein [Mesorhizobium sp.]
MKVGADHLRRDAFLYVRQSSLRQVFENTESTKRQYALRDRAVALGWPIERVHVIDSDLGLSGAQSQDRDGFQHLVSEVAMGHAGIVLGLEVSRLARNNADWHRLLELAALSRTLIMDEDGVMLLGLKGTMSEAELHILKSRLQGGILNKARRGELEMPLPIGLVYTPDARVVLDPDRQIQDTVRLLFDTFRETGSACAVVRRLRGEKILFPRRIRRGIGKGDVL